MGQICMKEVKVVEAPNTIPSTSESIVEEDVSFSKYEKENRIEDFHNRLNEDEIQFLLNIFLRRSRYERTFNSYCSNNNYKNNEPMKNKRIWKRLTINKDTLYNTFPNFHHYFIIKDLQSIINNKSFNNISSSNSEHNLLDNNNNNNDSYVTPVLNSAIVIIDDIQLFQAFKYSKLLLDNNNNNKEISFQDFALTLSICSHGTKEEMLSLLFILFSDVNDNNNSNDNEMSDVFVLEMDSSETESNKSGLPLNISNYHISENALYKLLLFINMYSQQSRYIVNNRNKTYSSNSSNNVINFNNKNNILEIVNILNNINNSMKDNNSNFSKYILSYNTFMTILIDQKSTLKMNKNIPTNWRGDRIVSDLRNCNCSFFSLSRTMFSFFDHICSPAYYNLKSIHEYYCEEKRIFLKNQIDNNNDYNDYSNLYKYLSLLDRDINLPTIEVSLPVFIVDSRWFRDWCTAMKVVPKYFKKSECPNLVVDIEPLYGSNIRSSSSEVSHKNIYLAKHYSYSNSSNTFHLRPKEISDFDNFSLCVYNNSPNSFIFKDLSTSSSCDSIEEKIDLLPYVILPYYVGAILYNEFEIRSKILSADNFKRNLIYLNHNKVIESEDQIENINLVIDQLMTNFTKKPIIYANLIPFKIPIYWCTRMGLSALNSFDNIQTDLKYKNNYIENDFSNWDCLVNLKVKMFIHHYLKKFNLDVKYDERSDVIESDPNSLFYNDIRIWGLYKTQDNVVHNIHTIRHSSTTEWLPLTTNFDDYQISLLQLLFEYKSVEKEQILSIMFECRNINMKWPTDRLFSSHFYKNNKRKSLYKVGQAVDVLTDNNNWMTGEIFSIYKQTSIDFKESKSFIKIKLEDKSDSNKSLNIDLPYYSTRILSRGIITDRNISIIHPLLINSSLDNHFQTYCSQYYNFNALSYKHKFRIETLINNHLDDDIDIEEKNLNEMINSIEKEIENSDSEGDDEDDYSDEVSKSSKVISMVPITNKEKDNLTENVAIEDVDKENDENSLKSGNRSIPLDDEQSVNKDEISLEEDNDKKGKEESSNIKSQSSILLSPESSNENLLDNHTTIVPESKIFNVESLFNPSYISPQIRKLLLRILSNGIYPNFIKLMTTVVLTEDLFTTIDNTEINVSINDGKILGYEGKTFNGKVSANLSATAVDSDVMIDDSKPENRSRVKQNFNIASDQNIKKNSDFISKQLQSIVNFILPPKKIFQDVKSVTKTQDTLTTDENGVTTTHQSGGSIDENAAKILSKEPVYRVGITGLNNMGNTCYLSSALQCLIRTPLLSIYFLSEQYRADINKSNILGTKGKLTEEFSKYLNVVFSLGNPTSISGYYLRTNSIENNRYYQNLLHKKYESISPVSFLKTFQHYKTYFNGNDQQDAQEFLSELLDTFHEDLKLKNNVIYLTKFKKIISFQESSFKLGNSAKYKNNPINGAKVISSLENENPIVNNITNKPEENINNNKVTEPADNSTKVSAEMSFEKINSLGNEKFNEYHQNNNSFISNIFQGQMCTKVICNECHNTSVKFEPFTFLSLSIPKSTISSTDSDKITIIITFYRKMPRLSQIWKYKQRHSDSITFKDLSLLYSVAKYPFRFVLNVQRQTTIQDIKIKASNFINSSLNEKNKEKNINIPGIVFHELTASLKLNDGTLRKELENKDSLLSIMEEGDSSCDIILMENNKDVSFISNLDVTKVISLTKEKPTKISVKVETDKLLYSFIDIFEYDPKSYFFNDEIVHPHNKLSDGKLFSDVDYIYQSLTNKTPLKRENSSNRNSLLMDEENSISWPTNISEFRIDTRVDAVDHKGTWFAGTIIDIFDISDAMIKKESLVKHQNRSSNSSNNSNIKNKEKGDSGNSNFFAKTKLRPGIHIRVHFDNFSHSWDEWYDQVDLETDCLAPVHTNSQRKLKILEFHVIQRKLEFPVSSNDLDRESKDLNGDEDKLVEGIIKVIEPASFIVHCESFRSLAHLQNHIIEQAFRYYDKEEVESLISSGWQDDMELPFTIRILSTNNNITIPNTIEDQDVDKKNTFVRFFGHKNWEGMKFPLKSNRPAGNIYHNRLVIAIDWFQNIRNSKRDFNKLSIDRTFSPIDDESYSSIADSLSEHNKDKLKPNSNIRTKLDIETCLKNFVSSEQLDEYFCDNCKKMCPATLNSSVFKLPDVLIVHLKRLVINAVGGSKIRTLVNFPLFDLDMKPFTTAGTMGIDTKDLNLDNDKQSLYNLYGVVNHLGGMHGGHYTAMTKCENVVIDSNHTEFEEPLKEDFNPMLEDDSVFSPNQNIYLSDFISPYRCKNESSENNFNWLKFDDEFVLEVPPNNIENSIVTESAYVLFYERRNKSSSNILKYA